jgi:endonuclease/exonuclease/phosphatase family metal-dependent hydrolase
MTRLLIVATWAVLMSSFASAEDLRIMSFNIRYGTASDGENHWDQRKEFLVETIQKFAPDLLGTQETLGFQRDYLAENLTGYEAIGVGRDHGDERGEMTAVLFRKERFEKLAVGHFWLSETPEVPGSKSWDTSLTRMVTWLKLKDRKATPPADLFFFNTHFDHRGEVARQESARLIRRQIATVAGATPTILTGDFNACEGSPPYQALFAEEGSVKLLDTFRTHYPQKQAEEGTFSGFKSSETHGARIDWIACTGPWKVIEAAIDRTAKDGRTPSDHCPVTAVLTQPEGERPLCP